MANTFTSIASTTLGGAAAAITFSSIPNTYDDLIIYCSLSNAGPGVDSLRVQFNGDTGNSYAYVTSRMNGATSITNASSNTTNSWLLPNGIGTTDSIQTYSTTMIYIAGYKSTSFTKAGYIDNFVGRYGSENNAFVAFSGQQFNSTNAITSIAISSLNQNLRATSSAHLYGIKRT